MKWLKSIVLLVAMLVAFLFAALAVNQQEITLSFAVWQTPFALSMFWWLFAAVTLVAVFDRLRQPQRQNVLVTEG